MSDDKFTPETITWVHTWVPGKLFSFRCTRSRGYRFVPGQFARLGVLPEDSDDIVWRAYSMVSTPYDDYLEFFSIVVDDGLFTGTLEHLRPGDTIYVDKTSYGFLTTDRFAHGVSSPRTLWMLSSGTGLAPFLSMLGDFHVWEDYRRIILVHSVRTPNELAYAERIESFATDPHFADYFAGHPNKLTYVPVITRPFVNHTQQRFLTKRITTLLDTGELEVAVDEQLDPATSCAMLCGNPAMVTDLRKRLQDRGFRAPRRGQPGNLAVENYW